MKKETTLKQFNEINRDKQKIYQKSFEEYNPNLLPNIQDMIEFLGGYMPDDDTYSLTMVVNNYGNSVFIGKKLFNEPPQEIDFINIKNKELCDALWEAVKGKLK